MKVAVIDVGFNSLKMVNYKVEPDGSAKSYGQLGVMAKLGEGLERTGYLGNEPISRTIDALRLCRETASLESVDHVLSIGTSPVREAANREEFLKRVLEVTGLKMRVLSGNEEALYGLVGAARSTDASNALFFDLGGGSLELTYAEKSRVRRILSLPLGVLKLTSMYAGKNGTFSRKDRAKMEKHVEQFLPSRRELRLDNETVLVGTGGTVRAMARYDQDITEYPFDKVHNYAVEFDSVQQMSREFFKLKVGELDRVDAIGEGRSETIAAGALVVRTLMKRLGFKRLTVSNHGLRDGILVEFLEGGVRSRNGDQILMSEDLPMSHRDQLLMAVSVVKARRSRTANWLMRRYDDVLSHDAKLVKKLGACLKLLEILDRSRAQYRVAYSRGLRISIIASKGPFPLELARMAALAFASTIKKPVTIFVSARERERHVGLVKVGSEVGQK